MVSLVIIRAGKAFWVFVMSKGILQLISLLLVQNCVFGVEMSKPINVCKKLTWIHLMLGNQGGVSGEPGGCKRG